MDLSVVRPIIRAVATTVVPPMSSLDERAWLEVERVIERALASRSPRVQGQLAMFLRLFQTLPIARYGRTFTALTTARRHAFLASVERSRLLILRRGFWGVRSLIFLAYYTREDVSEEIGYLAVTGGWEAHGGTDATVPLAPMLWIEQ